MEFSDIWRERNGVTQSMGLIFFINGKLTHIIDLLQKYQRILQ